MKSCFVTSRRELDQERAPEQSAEARGLVPSRVHVPGPGASVDWANGAVTCFLGERQTLRDGPGASPNPGDARARAAPGVCWSEAVGPRLTPPRARSRTGIKARRSRVFKIKAESKKKNAKHHHDPIITRPTINCTHSR